MENVWSFSFYLVYLECLNIFFRRESAAHSSILAWKIPRTEEPGGLQSERILKSWTRLSTTSNTHRHTHTHTAIVSQVSYSAAAAKSLQSCPTLCDPIDGSPPGSPVPGIFQARTLEWVAISFSNLLKSISFRKND